MAVEVINDRYEVLRRLGSGGMGDVWLAVDTLLGRNVAIKFVGERELRETPGAREVLRDEAKALGSLLGNPQVVSLVDLIEVGTPLHDGPALVMEYVEGCNLAEWITIYAPRLDDRTRQVTGLYIALEVIQANHAAHGRGILHRDIKPLNVLISTEGRVKVTDFGLARVIEEITRTHTMRARQTPLYAAPEQWREEKSDATTDVYQLAATLYHLLAGRPANEGNGLWGLYRWLESGTPVPLSERDPTLDAEVAAAITKGLNRERTERGTLWSIFDSISKALMKPYRVVFDASKCTEEKIERIFALTDINIETLKQPAADRAGTRFPNPTEAAQEIIAATLVGAECFLHDV
ncbi:serine/threonine protein kinase [Actinoplanes sp. KI2]|uniref:serine/threonine-protein kinase n=1 Tax=Actinoplanes sp. KI2 TaxID=2983315 RepID=UPI0021D5DDAB|nr:serine/threonine-protein kinase [Actinoplanes sp. KI2]MCU7728988.1 serine/threonine protein kinase [Actinoplanes sp. KI2]